MTKFENDRNKVTEKILSIINPNYTEETLLMAKRVWWTNRRKFGGFRLTPQGKIAFEQAEIEHWDLPIKVLDVVTPAAKLKLDQCLQCPYYLHVNMRKKPSAFIRIYDSRIVVMTQLCGGFANYLNTLEEKRIDLIDVSE